MNNFRVINNIIGWSVFLIALVTYYITLEPTASWWDCGEFIISAYKLEIGHPPGAPLHMILGRFFSLFAGDVSRVAFMVNLLSAVASAATIMLLYLSIVLLAAKLFSHEALTVSEKIIITGSGMTGSLAFAFTDSFWFSAVEGEVYALSSFFTAAVFWAILKWENESDEKYGNRWLILIAYLLGLSTGVHLLNLLAIPAIGLVYYFRKYDFTPKGLITCFLISGLILGSIQYVIIPGIPGLAFLFDKLFVNAFGLPFNSGILFFVVLIVFLLYLGLRYTRQNKLPLWNTVLTSVMMILIGYSSFALILIRADADPPMNQNHPDNAFALKRYLNREQYGNRPLFYGQYYNAPAVAAVGERKLYSKADGKYIVTGTTAKRTLYEPKLQTLFPRMYSDQSRHIEAYKEWGRIKGKPVRIRDEEGLKTVTKPTFTENLRFFFTYQLGHMYFRYFMWNFAGRQNDSQGHGSFLHGNWVSGIDLLDDYMVGPRDNMPEWMKKDPSRNVYYFLPLLLGLTGLLYQYKQGKAGREGFAVIMTLFVFTGIAIIIYLNQTPVQPRERDYAYTGSFYAFAIWIGLGIPAIYSSMRKVIKGAPGAIFVTATSLVLVPGLLFFQNFDDHDRSGRYMTRDYATNYLKSCAPDAILFTYGDNDTFPLWYVQEVEGVRPDVKIINISYLAMDWYINQHRRTSYEAKPVPFSFTKDQYYTGTRDIVVFQERMEDSIELSDAMFFLGSDDARSKLKMSNGQLIDFLPTRDFHITVDKQKVIESGTVQLKDSSLIADRVEFNINKKYLAKSEWAILNIIAANDWERPVYINHSLLHTGNIFFTDWLQFEGLAYRFVPIKTERKGLYTGHINTDVLYDRVINKYVWGSVNDPDIFLDEYNKRELKIIQARSIFSRLAEALIDEGKNDKAVKVVDRMFELFPDEIIPLSYDSFNAAEQYLRAGEVEKGSEKLHQMAINSLALLNYYITLPEYFAVLVHEEQDREMGQLQNLMVLTRRYRLDDLNKEIDSRLQQLINRLSDESGS
jgi:hypothetical protein